MLYVTPQRFRHMGLGVDLSGKTDAELRSILTRASRRVNAICATPSRPAPHDFRGGMITDEQHLWRSAAYQSAEAQRRVFLWHYPIISIDAMRLLVTNQQHVEFAASELVVTDRYVEIASLAMTVNGLFGSAVAPIIGLAQPILLTSYIYGEEFEVVDEQLEPDETDEALYRSTNNWWTGDGIEVSVDGVGKDSPADYTYDVTEGTILFVTAPGTDSIVTASYWHKLDPDVAEATALMARHDMNLSSMNAQLGGLQRVRVAEIELEAPGRSRTTSSSGTSKDVTSAPESVYELLTGKMFTWAGA